MARQPKKAAEAVRKRGGRPALTVEDLKVRLREHADGLAAAMARNSKLGDELVTAGADIVGLKRSERAAYEEIAALRRQLAVRDKHLDDLRHRNLRLDHALHALISHVAGERNDSNKRGWLGVDVAATGQDRTAVAAVRGWSEVAGKDAARVRDMLTGQLDPDRAR